MLQTKRDCVNRNLICQLCQLPLLAGDGSMRPRPHDHQARGSFPSPRRWNRRGAKRFRLDPEWRPDHRRGEVPVARIAQVLDRRPGHHLHRMGQGRPDQHLHRSGGPPGNGPQVLRAPGAGPHRPAGPRRRHAADLRHRGNDADRGEIPGSPEWIFRPRVLLPESAWRASALDRSPSAVPGSECGDHPRSHRLYRGSG